LLVSAGSGVSQLNRSSSAGVPSAFIEETVSIPFNDEKAVERAFAKNRGKVAAVIVEPVPANMGVILPREGFLEFLRNIAVRNGALLIFDEVITGFRWHPGGAQGYFNIRPDLTTLGKIIGGGFPVGAFGGRGEIMKLLAPEGPVYQAGTLSGNPVAMAAGIAVLDALLAEGVYERLNTRAEYFFGELSEITRAKKLTLNAVGTMFSIFCSENPISSYSGLKGCDTKRFAGFYRGMLRSGIYFSPAQGEANFISQAHSAALLNQTKKSIIKALK
jgi:glutamate-1-semialdehyde 2,1-aminomutase